MSEKKMLGRRFEVEDMRQWQENANYESGGNLTSWIENRLNRAVPLRDSLTRIEQKLDEVLGDYVDWEDEA